MRIGLKLLNGLPLDDEIALARYAEARGLDSVWVAEYRDRDGLVPLAVLARATERIAVGCSIVPIYTRSPVVLAMTAGSLWECAPGRVLIGLGTSTDVVVRQWNGRERERPIAAIRQYVRIIRGVLAGETVSSTADDVIQCNGFRHLHPELTSAPAILVAALGPRMLAEAGAISDGVLLNLVTAEHVPAVRAAVEAGAAAVGRDTPGLRADVRVSLVDSQTRDQVTDDVRRLLASYGKVAPYNALYAAMGFAPEAAALRPVDGSKGAGPAGVSDRMLHSVAAIGTENEVLERLDAYAKAGLDEAILLTGDDARTHDERATARRLIDLAARYKARA